MSDTIQWLIGGAKPRRLENGIGSSMTSWKLHAVRTDATLFSETAGLLALCGFGPKYGWSLDAHVDRLCGRCAAIAARSGDKQALAQLEMDRIVRGATRA